jgi:transketolase
MALAKKIKKEEGKIYVIIGDGECNEGTIWESALLASHHNLDNLYCFLDYNRSGDRAVKLDNIEDKFVSFNWNTSNINGHDHNQLQLFICNNNDNQKPNIAICNTIKGHGIPIMENNPEWHHKIPNNNQIIL